MKKNRKKKKSKRNKEKSSKYFLYEKILFYLLSLDLYLHNSLTERENNVFILTNRAHGNKQSLYYFSSLKTFCISRDICIYTSKVSQHFKKQK